MARQRGRTAPCGLREARTRLAQARKYAEAAELVLGESEFSGVAASLAVLAGIAASDAVCCGRLGEHHRGPDHRGAAMLLATVEPGGPAMSTDLQRLLDRKDDAHYGLFELALNEERRMVRWAARLVDAADHTLGTRTGSLDDPQ